MKYFIIIILVHVFSNSYAQEYELSESKPYKNKKFNQSPNGSVQYKLIYLIKNKKDTIAHYEVEQDFYYSKSIEISKVSGIDNIKSKIKVDISIMGCCTSIETYYYLITKNDQIKGLNKILNTECDGLLYKYDLIFPDDPKGVKNSIYLGRLIYDKKNLKSYPGKVKYRELINAIHFDNS